MPYARLYLRLCWTSSKCSCICYHFSASMDEFKKLLNSQKGQSKSGRLNRPLNTWLRDSHLNASLSIRRITKARHFHKGKTLALLSAFINFRSSIKQSTWSLCGSSWSLNWAGHLSYAVEASGWPKRLRPNSFATSASNTLRGSERNSKFWMSRLDSAQERRIWFVRKLARGIAWFVVVQLLN